MAGPYLEFDGVDNYVTIPFFQNPGAAGQSWTFMLVFRDRDPTSNHSIFSQAGSFNTANWLHVLADRTIICNLATNFPGLQFGTVLADTWYCAILRRDAAANKLYGSLRRTGSAPSSQLTPEIMQSVGEGTHYLGGNALLESQFFAPIDCAMMCHYNRALADAEITQMFDHFVSHLAGRGISL
jgi:hypothetical protein